MRLSGFFGEASAAHRRSALSGLPSCSHVTMRQSGMDLHPTEAVSQRMRRVKRRDNLFEKSIRCRLYSRGVRYRIHFPLPGLKRTSCDLAMPGLKIAVFLDGCFWHGCETHSPVFKKNAEFWLAKIERNRKRDQDAVDHLKSIGWTVLRFWEHEEREHVVDSIVAARHTAMQVANEPALPPVLRQNRPVSCLRQHEVLRQIYDLPAE